MLKSLKIVGFKSIRSAELKFGRSNIFIGPNGSGKSNILEALGVLSSALSRGFDPGVLADRGVRLSLPRLFKSAFKGKALSPHLRLEAQFENGHYECSIRAGLSSKHLEFHSEMLSDGNVKVFGRGPNGVTISKRFVDLESGDFGRLSSVRSVWDTVSPFAKISEGLRAELEEFSRFAIFAPQTAVMRGLATESRIVHPLGLAGSGLAGAFRDVLRKRAIESSEIKKQYDAILGLIKSPGWVSKIIVGGFDPSIVPSEVTSDGLLLYFQDRFMTEKRRHLSAYDASEGTLYLTFIATLLLHKEAPRIFALDNVDGTLNPDLVRQLTETVVNVSSSGTGVGNLTHQSFMTSHHPSSIDSFDIFNDMHRVYTAKRNEDRNGSTEFIPIVPPAGMTKEEWIEESRGHSLSRLWLDDKIPGALIPRCAL